jgi:toxin ParE1/3/4
VSHRVHLTEEAERDLDEAWDYLARATGHRLAGDRLFDEMARTFDLLAVHPEMGRVRSELQEGVRSFALRRYTIFYRIRRKEVDVLRVLHHRRDVGEAFGSS